MGDQLFIEILKFGYINNFQIIVKRVKKLQNLRKINICNGKLIKNYIIVKKYN